MSEQQQHERKPKETSSVDVQNKKEKSPRKPPLTDKIDKPESLRPDEANTSNLSMKTSRRKQSQTNAVIIKRNDSSEKIKHNIPNKISLTTKPNPPESIPLEQMTPIEPQKKAMAIPEELAQITAEQTTAQPVPVTVDIEAETANQETHVERESPEKLEPIKTEVVADEESALDEITELRTQPKFIDWSDEEEAGGLSRSSSRASRVSRAVRQLFCCGVAYEAPEEDNISYHRTYAI